MSAGRHGIDHGQRNAFADQPVGGEFCRRCRSLHRALDQIEALIEAVAAVEHVGMLGARRRPHRIARLHDVAAADFERTDAEALRQFVDRGFHRKQGLWQAVAAKGA